MDVSGGVGSSYLMVGNSGAGTFYQNGGSVNVGTYLRVAEGGSSTGVYQMTAGTLTVGSQIIVGRRSTGTFLQSGGTVNGPTAIYLGYEGNGRGEWQLSGTGVLNANSSLSIGQGATGIFKQSGGTVNVRSNLILGVGTGTEGNYEISAGLLDIDGILRNGADGTGQFKIVGDAATILTDGYVQNAASTLELVIDSGLSPIQVDGTISLAGMLDVEVLAPLAAFEVIPVFVNDGADAVTGIFDGLPEGALLTLPGSNRDAWISYSANVDGGAIGNDVVLTAVPEPSALLLLALGLSALTLVPRRPRKPRG